MTGSEAAIWGDDAVLRKEHAKAENSEVADQDVVMVDSSINSAADVTTTESSSATSPASPQAVDSSSSKPVAPQAVVEPPSKTKPTSSKVHVKPQSAKPTSSKVHVEPKPAKPTSSKVHVKPKPPKAASSLPKIAIDETRPQKVTGSELAGTIPRIPSERKFRKPGPSPLSRVFTPDVPIPASDSKSRFIRSRFWTPTLEPGELPDGTWSKNPPPPPWESARRPGDYAPGRPRPPHPFQIHKTQRDLRVAAPLPPQLLKRRAFSWAAGLKENILITLWRARDPAWRVVFHEFAVEHSRRISRMPRVRYDCELPRPVSSKGTPSGLDVPHPSRPRLTRPVRKHVRKRVTVRMPWDAI